jgi:hypothetical protein
VCSAGQAVEEIPELGVEAPALVGADTVLGVLSAAGEAAGGAAVGLVVVVGTPTFDGGLVAWVQAVTPRLKTVTARKVWVRRAPERFMMIPSVRRGVLAAIPEITIAPCANRRKPPKVRCLPTFGECRGELSWTRASPEWML